MSEAAEARALRKEAEAALRLDHKGRFDEALARANELAAKHPGSALVLYLAGRLHHGAANRALRASEEKGMAMHLISAYHFLAEAKRLVPNCVEIATMLARVLFERLKFEEAETEARRAIGIPHPVDPAENSVAYGVVRVNTTMEDRVENARSSARFHFKQIAAGICAIYVPDKVREVLDISKSPGAAAEALKRAKELAERFIYSSRAQYFHGYMKLKFACGLDPIIDKRRFLDDIRVDMNNAASMFDSSLVIAMFRAKLCLTLGFYVAAEEECWRAIGMSSPIDPGDEDVPPGSINGEEYDDRVSSIRTGLNGLLQKLLSVAKDYWCSMTSEKQDEFLSVRIDELHVYYDKVYEEGYWATRTISDALSFVKKNRSWRFWICPFCVGKKLLDVNSLLIHMHNKHPTTLSKLQSVLDPKPIGEDTFKGDYSLDEITVCQDSDKHYVFHFKKTDFMFESLFVLPSRGIEAQSFSEIQEMKCAEGTKILKKLKQKLNSLAADRSGTEFDKARSEIKDLWHKFLAISVLDYVEVILPLAKSFLWSTLLKCMSKDANIASKRIGAADIDTIFCDVADAPGSNMTMEHGSKPSHANRTDHTNGDNQHIKNLRPSSSMTHQRRMKNTKKVLALEQTKNVSQLCKGTHMYLYWYSEVHVEDLQANVELDTKGDSSISSGFSSTSDLNYSTSLEFQLPILDNTACQLLETFGQPAEELPSTSSYQRTVDVLNEINADEDLFILYAIIQSLSNLRDVREGFLKGPPKCFLPILDNLRIAKVFYEIVSAWEKNEHHGVAPLLTSVKTTLCKNVNDSNTFHKVGKNNSSEVMATVLMALHVSEMSLHYGFNTEMEGQVVSPITCRDCICRTHNLFGIKFHVQMSCMCGKCFDEKEHTTIIHKLDAGSPQPTKIKSFAELPVLWDEQLCCMDNCEHCGTPRNIDIFLSNAPHFFTIVLCLDYRKSQVTFSEVLAGITSPLDVKLFYKDVHSAANYTITSMICYADGRYVCFARDQDRWLIFDAKTVEIEDTRERLLERFKNCKLQPEVLVFEVIK